MKHPKKFLFWFIVLFSFLITCATGVLWLSGYDFASRNSSVAGYAGLSLIFATVVSFFLAAFFSDPNPD